METEERERFRRLYEEFFELPAGTLQEITPEGPNPAAAPGKRSWWWVELWWEKRPLFKEAVAHVFLFAGLLVSLEIAHRLLKLSTLPIEELDLLNKVHFYMYAIILVIFAFSFIIKVLKSEFGRPIP